MSFQEYTIQEPLWLKALVEDVVVDAFEPLGFIGPLGYRYWGPGDVQNQFDGWQVCVFPTPVEVRGCHPGDGALGVQGFRLDVAHLIKALGGAIEMLVWHSPTRYNQDLDGPELSVQGQFAGKRVWLRVFNLPPPDEPAACFFDPRTGQGQLKPQ